jgi:hypothetical protein
MNLNSPVDRRSTKSSDVENKRIKLLVKKKKKREKVLMCKVDDCLIFLNNEDEFTTHMATHKVEHLHSCKLLGCGKMFITEENLMKHKKAHFPIRKLYKCDFPGCTKSFTASYNQKVILNLL